MEWYPYVKMVHVAAVVTSGSLFLLRGIGVQAGARFAMAAPVRFMSYIVDTVLLAAAVGLLWLLQDMVLASSWVWVKVLLLPVYIILGSFGLKRAASRPAKLGCFIAALAVFAFMYRVARTHDPLAGLVY
jgi:uncharacterized membrane protein SirB2